MEESLDMTGHDALEFKNELKKYMEGQAIELQIEKEVGIKFVDKYVEVYPDEIPIMGILDLNKKDSYSIKGKNVLINQRVFLEECLSLGLEFQIPETKIEIIKLFIRIFIGMWKSMKIDLNEYESYIVSYLHLHQMYDKGDQESEFYNNFSLWYENQTENKLNDKQIENAIDNLIILKAIAIEDGEIRLKEKVWRDELSKM